MTTLRELTSDLHEIQQLAMDPEIPADALANTIEGLEGMFNDKAVRIVHVIANQDSDIEAIDAEIKRLQERKRVRVNAQERLKDYLRFNMERTGITKIESDLFTITLVKPRQIVVIDDEQQIPEDYQRVTVVPDKTLIGKALKDGYEVKGAHLGEGKSSVRIK
jgi:hypothetical protein